MLRKAVLNYRTLRLTKIYRYSNGQIQHVIIIFYPFIKHKLLLLLLTNKENNKCLLKKYSILADKLANSKLIDKDQT